MLPLADGSSSAAELRGGAAAFSSIAVGTPVKAVTLGMPVEPASSHETIARLEANIVHNDTAGMIHTS